MAISSLQNVFNKILAEETVSLLFTDKASYDSTRVALLRKFRNLRQEFEKLGFDDPYNDRFVKSSFDRENVRGTFVLASKGERKNTPNAERFTIDGV